MKEDVKTFRFCFKATIGQFVLNAPNINSPITATWRRSSESVSTSTVEMVAGRANFNQTIELPLNMYYQQSKKQFQDKKTLFTFTMTTPKGEKQAGIAYVEVAQILNNQLQNLSEYFVLEKCPVKDSKVHITIVAEFVREENAPDNPSVDPAAYNPSVNPSPFPAKEQEKVEKEKVELDERDKTISTLQNQVKLLQKQKQELARELSTLKLSMKNDNLGSSTGQVSKTLQERLETEIANMRSENSQHEKQLQKMRIRMEELYALLQGHFNA